MRTRRPSRVCDLAVGLLAFLPLAMAGCDAGTSTKSGGTGSKKVGSAQEANGIPGASAGNPGIDINDLVPNSSTILSAPRVEELPPCDEFTEGKLSYLTDTKELRICQSAAWALIETGRPGGGDVVTALTDEPVGDQCRYGGKKVASGIDDNGNGMLENEEASSVHYVCEGNLASASRSIFAAHFKSVGLVVTRYVAAGLPTNTTCNTRTAGTGWVAGADSVVTNEHVVRRALPCLDAFGQPIQGQVGTLTEVKVFLPKTTLTAEKVLAEGLPGYAGYSPSPESFDEFSVAVVDRTPTSDPVDRADLAFLQVLGHGRPSLTLNKATPTSEGAESLKVADDVLSIGYSLTQGPRSALGNVIQITNCRAWMAVAATTPAAVDALCTDELFVRPDARLFQFHGYGDRGGSGGPIFDRFGTVVGVLTWRQGVDESAYVQAQFASELRPFVEKPRVWKALAAP